MLSYYFLYFGGNFSFLPRKIWPGKMLGFRKKACFPMQFSSESPQILYMDSLYQAHQYVGNYMLIYILLLAAFPGVFSVFHLEKFVLGI